MPNRSDRRQEIIIAVSGMTGENCERDVAEALSAVPGVVSASASRHEGQAIVSADPVIASPELLCAAIAKAGFEPGEVRFPE